MCGSKGWESQICSYRSKKCCSRHNLAINNELVHRFRTNWLSWLQQARAWPGPNKAWCHDKHPVGPYKYLCPYIYIHIFFLTHPFLILKRAATSLSHQLGLQSVMQMMQCTTPSWRCETLKCLFGFALPP